MMMMMVMMTMLMIVVVVMVIIDITRWLGSYKKYETPATNKSEGMADGWMDLLVF